MNRSPRYHSPNSSRGGGGGTGSGYVHNSDTGPWPGSPPQQHSVEKKVVEVLEPEPHTPLFYKPPPTSRPHSSSSLNRNAPGPEDFKRPFRRNSRNNDRSSSNGGGGGADGDRYFSHAVAKDFSNVSITSPDNNFSYREESNLNRQGSLGLDNNLPYSSSSLFPSNSSRGTGARTARNFDSFGVQSHSHPFGHHQNTMVLSKVQNPGNVRTDVIAFLREFKTLECSCCNELLGFQHRVTGQLFCNPDCHQRGAAELGGGEVEMKRAATAAINGDTVEQPKKPLITGPRTINTSSAPVTEEKVYKHVSSIHKYEDPKQSSVPVPKTEEPKQPSVVKKITKEPVVSSQPISQDAVDHKVAPGPVKCEITVAPLPSKKKEESDGRAYEMLPAEAIRKDVNPFFQNIPASKSAATSKGNLAIAQQPEKPKRTRYMWKDCKYTENLFNGAMVKTTFVWGIDKYQICGADDEAALVAFQAKLQKYCGSQNRMTEVPSLDEIVIGEYGGEFYRGRVMAVNGNKCHLLFVDFGDEDRAIPSNTLVEMNDELFQEPIYSAKFKLNGVPDGSEVPDFRAPKRLNKIVFGELQMEMLGALNINDDTLIQVKLWIDKESTLNKKINDSIAENASAALNSIYKKIKKVGGDCITEMFNKNESLLETLELHYEMRMVLFGNSKGDEKPQKLIYPQNVFIGSINHPVGKKLDVEVKEFRSIGEIYVMTATPVWMLSIEGMSNYIDKYITNNKLSPEFEPFEPEPNQVFLVKWLQWSEFSSIMQNSRGAGTWVADSESTNWESTMPEGFFDMNKDSRFEGKWFRSYYQFPISGSHRSNENCCVYYLFDLCKFIAVPREFVYLPCTKISYSPQLSVRVSLLIPGVEQYTSKLNETLQYILKPGTVITIKKVGDIMDTMLVGLVKPVPAKLLAECKRVDIELRASFVGEHVSNYIMEKINYHLLKEKEGYWTAEDLQELLNEIEDDDETAKFIQTKLKEWEPNFSVVGAVDFSDKDIRKVGDECMCHFEKVCTKFKRM